MLALRRIFPISLRLNAFFCTFKKGTLFKSFKRHFRVLEICFGSLKRPCFFFQVIESCVTVFRAF